MVIYMFSTWGAWKSGNGVFEITEIEVEEKPKSYIGKGTRVLKDDIDKLKTGFGDRMYRLSNDPKPYISAVINRLTGSVEAKERQLMLAKKELALWEALQKKGC